jgi:hypothetical protein
MTDDIRKLIVERDRWRVEYERASRERAYLLHLMAEFVERLTAFKAFTRQARKSGRLTISPAVEERAFAAPAITIDGLHPAQFRVRLRLRSWRLYHVGRLFPREPPAAGDPYGRASGGQPAQPVSRRRSFMPCRFGDLSQGRPRPRAKGLNKRRLPGGDGERIDDADRSAPGRL